MSHNNLKSHKRNRYQGHYDFNELIKAHPELKTFIQKTDYGHLSINFTDPQAVKALNQALLKSYYNLIWDIPSGFLCPPIPSRADYIHNIADLLAESCGGKIPTGQKVKILDVGTGANLIYPLIGHAEYRWHFVASDVNEEALKNAQKLIDLNHLNQDIQLRHQRSKNKIFEGIIDPSEKLDACVCNPPFHASEKQAQEGTLRKWKNLKIKTKVLNFGGAPQELWCEGGEVAFITQMIKESPIYNITWFTALVSKQESLSPIYKSLEEIGAEKIKTIQMGQGQKKSRIVAWTFKGTK